MKYLLSFALLFSLLATGCDSAMEDLPPPRDLTVAEKRLAATGQEFGLALFREMVEADPDENLFVSPLSVSMALGMALNGARGETRDEMLTMLDFHGLAEQEVNEAYRGLIDLLLGLDPRVELAIANSVWHRDTFAVEADFLARNGKYFDAIVRGLDFEAPDAPAIINAWVKDRTRGHIPELLEYISPLEVMFLINAIYFKGDWSQAFDRKETRKAPFRLTDGSSVEVDMMQRKGTYRTVFDPAFTAAELPYGRGLFHMLVIVPGHDGDLSGLLETLNAEFLQQLDHRFRENETTVRMPRFKIEYDVTLEPMLRALGMNAAFSVEQADFSGINPLVDDLHITRVDHRAVVEVNEKGTVAAAATAVGVGIVSAPPSVTLDRPFVFAIREAHSGTILFIGKMMDPTR
jgi:serine protease inhibitor